MLTIHQPPNLPRQRFHLRYLDWTIPHHTVKFNQNNGRVKKVHVESGEKSIYPDSFSRVNYQIGLAVLRQIIFGGKEHEFETTHCHYRHCPDGPVPGSLRDFHHHGWSNDDRGHYGRRTRRDFSSFC